MTDDLEELKRRLVVGQKRDGRCVYDEAAKSALVALCLKPGASVSRLARECGVNANQVARWLREHGHGRRARTVGASVTPTQPAFVALPMMPTAAAMSNAGEEEIRAPMNMQARLPNDVSIELRGVAVRHIGEVIEALGRLQCSASTKR